MKYSAHLCLSFNPKFKRLRAFNAEEKYQILSLEKQLLRLNQLDIASVQCSDMTDDTYEAALTTGSHKRPRISLDDEFEEWQSIRQG